MNPWTVPNFLTHLRFAVAFWLMVTIISQSDALVSLQWYALVFFAVGSVTDFFDGKIARRWPSQRSELGKLIDPIADKVLVFSYMLYLLALGAAGTWFEYTCFAIITAREIAMQLWRWCGGADLLPVSRAGKWKTALQMSALAAYGLMSLLQISALYPVAVLLLVFATTATVLSLVLYLLSPRKTLAS